MQDTEENRSKVGSQNPKGSESRSVVLCIDDEAAGLKLRSYVLELEGYSVLVANSGAEGLELFRQADPDLVVLDQSMPGMTGEQVAAQMRCINPKTPLILLSAHVDLPKDTLSLFDACLTKGESPSYLLRHMHHLLADEDCVASLRRNSD